MLSYHITVPILSMVSFILSAIIIILVLIIGVLLRPLRSKNDRKLPPGPRGLPIIGSLHLLGDLPHRNVAKLAEKYGPIMSLKLGSIQTIIVSSAEAAEKFLKTHDTIFASRPELQAFNYISYGRKAMAFTEYGPYWRNVRKLCTLQLLSVSKVESFAPLRKEELGNLLVSLQKSVMVNEEVNLTTKIGELMESITFRTVLGKNNDDEFDLKPLIDEAFKLCGAFNIGDYVPWLRFVDLQGLERRMKTFRKSMDRFLEKIIEERLEDIKLGKSKDKDFIGVLVALLNQPMNPNDEHSETIDRTNVKAIVMDMIAGSLDTSTVTILWIFSELLRQPRLIKCMQEELENVVGLNRTVEEKDLSKLTYLDMVIKENFRLHPTGPFFIPHESMEDITINGYFIPKNSRVLFNNWGLGKDPNVWPTNVDAFVPERFMNNDIDIKGQDIRLMPFGFGRRKCPGIQSGLLNVQLIVAQLVHCFDWELPYGMSVTDLDMTEQFGLVLPRKTHLIVVPTRYRLTT